MCDTFYPLYFSAGNISQRNNAFPNINCAIILFFCFTDKKKKKKKRRVEVEVQEGAHLTITDKTPAGLTVTPEANAAASAVPVLGHQDGQVTRK